MLKSAPSANIKSINLVFCGFKGKVVSLSISLLNHFRWQFEKSNTAKYMFIVGYFFADFCCCF